MSKVGVADGSTIGSTVGLMVCVFDGILDVSRNGKIAGSPVGFVGGLSVRVVVDDVYCVGLLPWIDVGSDEGLLEGTKV